MCLKIYYVYKRLKSNWKKLTCIPIIFRFQFRYILPFFTNECKRLMLPGSLKRTSSSKGSQKLRTQGWKVTNCVYWRLCKTIFGKWMNFCKYVSITYSLTKVRSFSKFCFAQSSVDTICDFPWTHNGGNDSYIRQSQLWHQIICPTKTAKFFLWNWLVILMPCNSWILLQFGKKTPLP